MMTSTIVSGVWRSHAVLDESEPDSSPEAPQQFKKMRSTSSLNSLRMSLRKRLPLKPVQSNVNISENPTWESLQMNQNGPQNDPQCKKLLWKRLSGVLNISCLINCECTFFQSLVIPYCAIFNKNKSKDLRDIGF